MKTQLIKYGQKWSLYGAVVAAMLYSALTLTSEPARAGTCTPQLCAEYRSECTGLCEDLYQCAGITTCPYPPVGGSNVLCRCACNGRIEFYMAC
jgi:hypothetical protein